MNNNEGKVTRGYKKRDEKKLYRLCYERYSRSPSRARMV